MLFVRGFFTAQEATVKKIVNIVRRQFAEEIRYKESEIALIDQVRRTKAVAPVP